MWNRSNVAARSQLRSARRHLVVVPRCNRSKYGRLAFSVAGPMTWNSAKTVCVIHRCPLTVFVASSKHFYLIIRPCVFSALEIFLLMRYINDVTWLLTWVTLLWSMDTFVVIIKYTTVVNRDDDETECANVCVYQRRCRPMWHVMEISWMSAVRGLGVSPSSGRRTVTTHTRLTTAVNQAPRTILVCSWTVSQKQPLMLHFGKIKGDKTTYIKYYSSIINKLYKAIT